VNELNLKPLLQQQQLYALGASIETLRKFKIADACSSNLKM